MRPLLLLALTGCAPDPAPPACVQMCAEAAVLYGGCLEEWGAGWEAAGYADQQDFLGACETWAWQMGLLEEDAVQAGEAGAAGATLRACRTRATAFADPAATCETYTGIDWNTPPWDAAPADGDDASE